MNLSARQLVLTIAVVLLCSIPVRAQEDTFPQPAELQPDVDFWTSIFTEVSNDEGVLHDNRYLGVVYEIMPMPANTGRRQRNREVSARRSHYQAILATLAKGKRENLSSDEYRVLGLWPDDVSNETLQAAVGQIRFQHGLSDRFEEGLIRAGRWRDHVNAEFSSRGVPIELAALPHVESSYNPAARSHVGASGIWQFTRSTGRRFMQVDHVLDERNDPFLATEAAAKLLAYNYSIAGNWPMAITAYNHGLAGVRRAMRAHGDKAYVDILRKYRGRAFGFASRNFYVAFLAAKHVDQNADKYFPGIVPAGPVDYERYRLDDYVSAAAVSRALRVSERELAKYNPAAQATIWQGSKYMPREFEIRVPADMLDAPISELIAALPADERLDRQLPDMYHRIARGDTLSEIATEYDTTVSTLVALNSLGSRNRIRAGQQLRLPAAGPAPVVAAADTGRETPVPAADVPPVVAAVESTGAANGADAALPASTAEVGIAPPLAAVANAPALPAIPDLVSAPDEEEVVDAVLADESGIDLSEPVRSALLSDPSDYNVAADLTIEIHPMETLGHYADWLGIRTQRLRDINGLAFRTPVEVGERLKLLIEDVDIETFENQRIAYHLQLQDTYFRNHTISGIREHVVGRGESVWILSLRQYDTPIWLFRQYNPELDPHNVHPGTRLSFPVVESNEKT
jgi:membrane-bound lytic murein transglycosylase D